MGMTTSPLTKNNNGAEHPLPPVSLDGTAALPFNRLPSCLSALTKQHFPALHLQSMMINTANLDGLTDQQAQQICRQWLSDEERRQLQELLLPKRRKEWLGGRICAKQAALDFLAATAQGQQALLRVQDLKILSAPSGRPFLETLPAATPPPRISISHSGSFAVATATSMACGIDIQETRDTLTRVRDQFCTQEERALLTTRLPQLLPPAAHLTLLWAAKESIRKAISSIPMPGFLTIHLRDIGTGPSPECHFFSLEVETLSRQSGPTVCLGVTTHFSCGYATALCIIPELSVSGELHA